MAQGKKITKLHENRPQKVMPKDEWIIVENTHTAIIEQSLYDHVQDILTQRNEIYQSRIGKYDYFGKSENIFKGLVVCGSCGYSMTRYKNVYNKGKSIVYTFICPHHAMHLNNGCNNSGGLHEETLKEIVYDIIHAHMALLMKAEEIINKVCKSSSYQERRTALSQKIDAVQKRQKKIASLRMALFEKYVQGVVDKASFEHISTSYDTEEKNLDAELSSLNNELISAEHTVKDNKWYAAYAKFRDKKELSRLMLTELIEKIDIDSDKSVRVTLRYQDEMKRIFSLVETAEGGNENV